MIDQFLRFLLRKPSRFQIAGDIDVEKRGGAAQAHCRPVLLLDRGQIPEIQPLKGFLRGGGRLGNIVAVTCGHFAQFPKRADLLRDLLARADHVFAHRPFVE
ncbi:hypothetical protein D3C76_1178800 [compost metagenome]